VSNGSQRIVAAKCRLILSSSFSRLQVRRELFTQSGRCDAIQEEKSKSVVEKFQTIQDVCLQVQESMDVVASLFEQVEKSVGPTSLELVPTGICLSDFSVLIIISSLYSFRLVLFFVSFPSKSDLLL